MINMNDEIAEPLALSALFRIVARDIILSRENAGLIQIFTIKFVQTTSTRISNQSDVITSYRPPDESDFTEVGPGAGIGAAGQTQQDRLIAYAMPYPVQDACALHYGGH